MKAQVQCNLKIVREDIYWSERLMSPKPTAQYSGVQKGMLPRTRESIFAVESG